MLINCNDLSAIQMEIHRDINPSQYRIKSYQPGEICVNDQSYHHSLLVSPTNSAESWRPQTIHELTLEDIATLVSWQADIILLGTGHQHQQIATHLLAPLYQNKIGVEVMSSAAACRTFTVLSTDNRNVLAAVIIK